MDLADIVDEYMKRVQAVFATGETTEHSFRPALAYLFKHIEDDVDVINEPKLVTDVGRPDFAFKRKVGQNYLTIGHCEAKDINKGIDPRGMNDGNKNQFNRYIKGLPNLIYTNGLDFRFCVKGELIREITIGDYYAHELKPQKRNYHALAQALKEFAAERVQTITSAKRLAELMAGKAILIKTVLGNSLKDDIDLNTELVGQYKAFKEQLIHDLTPDGFADIYAETVAYGMFAARLHDDTPEDFSREEALDLLPKSNPFLRSLFSYVAGPTLDERIKRDIDELAEIFQATNLQTLFADFGHFTKRNDPFIHFYETFLAEYNPKKRKARGVWYTPEPVVNFIVRAVDDVLKTEFGLPMGLADTSKITVDVDTGQTKTVRGKAKPVMEKREMHRVQILDPATGTGTFLAEVIKQIAPKIKDVALGQWSSYVEKEMIPRIHGFELLMASYAMCHMKLDMMLKEMDYVPTATPPRLSVYLTNSLEEGDKEVRDLFMAQWLSNEAKAANEVKRDKPIMCIIGNPPYSGHSANKGKWIIDLMSPYMKEPGGKLPLDERNPKWVYKDEHKFIRLAEHYIEENGEGVLGYITSHGYLTDPTLRGMRWKLLKTFSKIYIVDLHGNSNIVELPPNNKSNKNVFDIKQGVSIIIGIKSKGQNDGLAEVFRLDAWGTRKQKYDFLWDNNLSDIGWDKVSKVKPRYAFLNRDWKLLEKYDSSFSVNEIFPLHSTGAQSGNETLFLGYSVSELADKLPEELQNEDIEYIRYLHKPFDLRHFTLFKSPTNGMKKGFIPASYRSRLSVSRHMIQDNIALLFSRSNKGAHVDHFFISSSLIDVKCPERSTGGMFAPLYLYPKEGGIDQIRRVNMDTKIRKAIVNAATDKRGTPDEVAIFDYIYGVLHCPAYRETYAEFLKIDFPRIPYPASPDVFWDVSAKGTELRKLHLMEPAAIGKAPYPFEGQGDSVVEKPKFEVTSGMPSNPALRVHDAAYHPQDEVRVKASSASQSNNSPHPEDGDAVVSKEGGGTAHTDIGVVHINKTQHFTNVPRTAWEFYIGGYQPAQKWLKDRKGRTLEFADIQHYQSIIKILCETDRIMKTIKMDLD